MFKNLFNDRASRVTMKFGEMIDDDAQFFYDLLLSERNETDSSTYLEIPGRMFGRGGEQSKLIIRDAYDALLPFVDSRWGDMITLVTGTPGVGLTYLGAYHLRRLVLLSENFADGKIVAYQKNGVVYAFSWHNGIAKHLNLKNPLIQILNEDKKVEKTLWCGACDERDTFDYTRQLLQLNQCYMIADPQEWNTSLHNLLTPQGNLVVYASHGHPLIQKFHEKNPVLSPCPLTGNMFVLPGWSPEELKMHRNLLVKTRGGPISEDEVEERIHVAGKMVRYFVTEDLKHVKNTIDSKIEAIIQSRQWHNMEDNFALVSLDIPDYDFAVSDLSDEQENESATSSEIEDAVLVDSKVEKDEGASVEEEEKEEAEAEEEEDDEKSDDEASEKEEPTHGMNTNPFSSDKAEKTHVCQYVIDQLESRLKEFTDGEIRVMARSWSTNGYMSVFDALFQRNCYVELATKGRSLPLFAVTPTGDKPQPLGKLEIPDAKNIFLLDGTDPGAIAEMDLVERSFVKPINSNYPTYDLFAVAGASALQVDDKKEEDFIQWMNNRAASTGITDSAPWKKLKYDPKDLLLLALQCTVSGGVSGVMSPRAKHKVYQNVLTQSVSASKEANKDIFDLCTVFIVPPICAGKFAYQVPQAKGKDVDTENRPEVQFVAAMKTRLSDGFEEMVLRRELTKREKNRLASLTINPPKGKTTPEASEDQTDHKRDLTARSAESSVADAPATEFV